MASGTTLVAACALGTLTSDALGQTVIPPGTVINVTTPGGIGVNSTGPADTFIADGITVNLAAGSTTGALSQAGGGITFNGSLVNTNSVGAAANGQIGLRSTGAGSVITATGATIDMTPASGTTNNMIGVTVDAAGSITLDNTTVVMGGGKWRE